MSSSQMVKSTSIGLPNTNNISKKKPLIKASTTSSVPTQMYKTGIQKLTKKQKGKNLDFLQELYPDSMTIREWLYKHVGMKNIDQLLKLRIFNQNQNQNQINESRITYIWFTTTLISIDSSFIKHLPNITQQSTSIRTLIEEYLRTKFSKSNYDRKSNVLTSGYYSAICQYNGRNIYIPLKNVSTVTYSDKNDSINYILCNKSFNILHQLCGDDIIYFLLNYSTILLTINPSATSNNNKYQYWQLTGKPTSQLMWDRKKNKIKIQKNLQNLNKIINIKNKKIKSEIINNIKRKNKNNNIKNKIIKKKSKTKGIQIFSEFNTLKCKKPFIEYNKLQKQKQIIKQLYDTKMNKFPETCELCNAKIMNEYVWHCHLNGKKHAINLKKKNHTYRCDPCKANIVGLIAYNQHIRLESHKLIQKQLKADRWCGVCKVLCTSAKVLNEHKKTSKSHLKNLNKIPKKCEICKVIRYGLAQYNQHIQSKKHKKLENIVNNRKNSNSNNNLNKSNSNENRTFHPLDNNANTQSVSPSSSVLRSFNSRIHAQSQPPSAQIKRKSSLLGKRKSGSMNFVNPRAKYRRLTANTTCVSDSKSIHKKPKIPNNRNSELRKIAKGIKAYIPPNPPISRSNLNTTEIKRFSMFYNGKNTGQFPLLSNKNLLQILPASNIGGELLVRYIFFDQHPKFFKQQKDKLKVMKSQMNTKTRYRTRTNWNRKSSSTQVSSSRSNNNRNNTNTRMYSTQMPSLRSPSASKSRSLSRSATGSNTTFRNHNNNGNRNRNRLGWVHNKSQSISTQPIKSKSVSVSHKKNKKKKRRTKRKKSDFIEYVPTHRDVRRFGGKLPLRYRKIIPFFKRVLVNYKKLSFRTLQDLIDGSEAEKRDIMYWKHKKSPKRNKNTQTIKENIDNNENEEEKYVEEDNDDDDDDDMVSNISRSRSPNPSLPSTISGITPMTPIRPFTTASSSRSISSYYSIFSSEPPSRCSTPVSISTTSNTTNTTNNTGPNQYLNTFHYLSQPRPQPQISIINNRKKQNQSNLNILTQPQPQRQLQQQPPEPEPEPKPLNNPKIDSEKMFKEEMKKRLTALVTHYRPYSEILKFIKTFLHRIFKHDIYWGLGNKYNKIKFRKFIYLIITAQRHEKFTMSQIMNLIKPVILRKYRIKSDLNRSIHNINIFWNISIKFIWWLLNDIILDILRFNFYITERSYTQGPVVTYYPVKIWKNIINTYLKQNRNMFQLLSKNKLFELKKDTNLGIGFLRFVPKPTSLRPIINLSKDSIIYDPSNYHNKKELIAPNKRLNQLFAILTHQVNQYKKYNKKEDILGSSVFSVREYYHQWIMFCRKYKKLNNSPKIYCVSADLSKCYDRVNQTELMKIVKKKLLYKESYSLLKYSAIFPEVGTIFQRYKYGIDINEIRDINSSRGPFIITNQGYTKSLSNKDILKLLNHHITTSIVYLNGSYYKHNVGISQGSIISQLLCCVYIGQCEKLIKKQILKNKNNKEESCRLMMRHVDDFIFWSTNRDECILFADILHNGIDQFNMLANYSKTTTNFKYVKNGNNLNNNSCWIPWCGFLWNTRTLNVRAHHRDHTLNIRNNLLTYNVHKKRGAFILSKLCKLIRHKIEPLLLDENINRKSNIIFNLYQSFYISGCRFCRFIISLPFRNEIYLFNILIELIQYTYNRIMVHKEIARVSISIPILFTLSLKQVQYIALKSYKDSIMKKYHGLFSRAFQQKLNKYIMIKQKFINKKDKTMFNQYTDYTQLMHKKLNDFVY